MASYRKKIKHDLVYHDSKRGKPKALLEGYSYQRSHIIKKEVIKFGFVTGFELGHA